MLPGDEPLPRRRLHLAGVQLAYSDVGSGEPILFVHGIPTSSYLWRNVIRALDGEYRSIAPDLMGLGETETPLDHRYDMAAQAEKLLELIDHLGLDTVTLVCHDQGGAAAQWLAVHHPDRIRRLILTNCVCYDNWPVPLVTNFARLLRVGPLAWFAWRSRFGPRWGKSAIGMRLGVVNPQALSDFAIEEYLKCTTQSRNRFEQFRRFVLAGDCRYSVEAAQKFPQFQRPTMVVWAADDRWLSVSWARRLYDEIAGATRLEIIPFAGHFVQEERPELLAGYIRDFITQGWSA